MADTAAEIRRVDAAIDTFAQDMKAELRRQIDLEPKGEWNAPVTIPPEQRRRIQALARDERPVGIALAALALHIRERFDDQ